jgi:hypothetical protein
MLLNRPPDHPRGDPLPPPAQGRGRVGRSPCEPFGAATGPSAAESRDLRNRTLPGALVGCVATHLFLGVCVPRGKRGMPEAVRASRRPLPAMFGRATPTGHLGSPTLLKKHPRPRAQRRGVPGPLQRALGRGGVGSFSDGMPEVVRASRRPCRAVFGPAYPYVAPWKPDLLMEGVGRTPTGTLEARPAKKRGSAVWGDRPGVGWLELENIWAKHAPPWGGRKPATFHTPQPRPSSNRSESQHSTIPNGSFGYSPRRRRERPGAPCRSCSVGHTPTGAPLEARPAKRRGSAAWGRPTRRRLARANLAKACPSTGGAGHPPRPGPPAPERKPTFTIPNGSLGLPEAARASRPPLAGGRCSCRGGVPGGGRTPTGQLWKARTLKNTLAPALSAGAVPGPLQRALGRGGVGSFSVGMPEMTREIQHPWTSRVWSGVEARPAAGDATPA